jgi:hypothetical protein
MKRETTVSWQDPAALAQAGRSMSGIDFLRAIRDGRLPSPPLAELLGFELTEVGVVHGGLAVTLLDSAMGCAVQTQMPAGSWMRRESYTRTRPRLASC